MGTVKYHMNNVMEKHQNKPKDLAQTVRKKEVPIVLPFLGHHRKHLTKQLKQLSKGTIQRAQCDREY